MAAEEYRRQRSAGAPLWNGGLAVNCVHCMTAADPIASLPANSVALAVLDWQWPTERPWRTVKHLPPTYPPAGTPKALQQSLDDICLNIDRLGVKMLCDGILAIHSPSTQEGVGHDEIRRVLRESGWLYDSVAVWQKKDVLFGGRKTLSNSCEFIWLYRRVGCSMRPLQPLDNVVVAPVQKQPVHPHQKPVALYERLILACCPASHLVVDLYAGSGSCGVAAVQTGRTYLGAELVPYYAAVANTRIRRALEQGGFRVA